MSPRNFDDFIGPCAHGRDPYTRCDEENDPEYGGCQNLPARCAELLAPRADAKRYRAALEKIGAERNFPVPQALWTRRESPTTG